MSRLPEDWKSARPGQVWQTCFGGSKRNFVCAGASLLPYVPSQCARRSTTSTAAYFSDAIVCNSTSVGLGLSDLQLRSCKAAFFSCASARTTSPPVECHIFPNSTEAAKWTSSYDLARAVTIADCPKSRACSTYVVPSNRTSSAYLQVRSSGISSSSSGPTSVENIVVSAGNFPQLPFKIHQSLAAAMPRSLGIKYYSKV